MKKRGRQGNRDTVAKRARRQREANVTYDRPLASVYYRFPKLISNSRGSVADGRSKGKKGEGPERELAEGCFQPRVLGDP